MGVFVDDDFDTTCNGDGDNGTKKAECVSADGDGDEDDDWAKIEGVALDFGGEDVDFDKAVNHIEDEPNDSHEGVAEEQDERNEDGADDLPEHRNEVKSASYKAQGDGEFGVGAEDEAENKDTEGSSKTIHESNGDLVADKRRNDARHFGDDDARLGESFDFGIFFFFDVFDGFFGA